MPHRQRHSEPDADNRYLREHVQRLLRSYRHWTGRDLLPAGSNPGAQALYEAPFVVLSHGGGEDPVFNYANRTAQRLFEYPWATFVQLPSRLSAEPDGREERAALLRQVRERGFADDYRGVRVAASGRRFWIENVMVWNLLDPHGGHCGQAASFQEWRYLD